MTTKHRLYPFPRLATGDATWSDWVAELDGERVDIDSVTDRWDANSSMEFGIDVRLSAAATRALQVDEVKLALTATCSETALAAYADIDFAAEGDLLVARGAVAVAGGDVSQVVEIHADIIGCDRSAPWLGRRLLVEGRHLSVALASELVGFPTASMSFDKCGIPAAPWRIIVSADALEDPFAHSIRLELNDDYPAVKRLINGKPDAHVAAELNSSITRTLLGTVARLSEAGEESERVNVDDVAAEFPDSITAAAHRAVVNRTHPTLAKAVTDYRLRPERLEYDLAAHQQIMKG